MTTASDTDLKDELLKQGQRYLAAVAAKDGATIGSMTDRTCLVSGEQGVMLIDPVSIQQMVKAQETLNRYELDESSLQVVSITDDVAVAGYTLRTTPIDGSPPHESHDTDVWVRRDGRWVCAAHSDAKASS